jgi:hypothetical protein
MSRRPTRHLLTMALVLGLFVLGSPAASAASPPTGAGAPPDDTIAVGLARDRGISLAEAEQRLGWQDLAPRVSERAAAALGDTFGGVWIDAANGDRVKIGVATPPNDRSAAVAQAAAAAAGLTDGVDVVFVRHPSAQLDAGIAWLGGQLATVNAGARQPLGAGVRTDLNALELHTPAGGSLTDAQSALVATAQRMLGDALVLGSTAGQPTALSCTYPFCDPPLRGGIQIGSPSGVGCTGAFIAQSRVDTQLYQLTAGHCGQADLGPWGTQFTNGSAHLVGPIHHWEWNSGGDEAIMLVNNPAGWQLPSGTVNVTAGPQTTADPNYAIKSEDFSVLGQRICTTGSFLGFSNCGTVTELDDTETYGGVTVSHLGRASLCAVPGDSGAPMYARHVAFGLLVAGFVGACDTFYQGILAAESVLNVNILHQ